MSGIRSLLRMGRERRDTSSGVVVPQHTMATGGTLKASGATWTLTGSNSGMVTNLSGTFAGMANLTDTSGGVLKATDAIWTLTSSDSGTVTNLSGTFAGMTTLSGADKGEGKA